MITSSHQVSWPTVTLRGVGLHVITEAQCVLEITTALSSGHGGWVVTPNLDHLRRLVHDHSFAQLCDGATLMVADGMPLIWASRLQGTPLPQRVAGSNLISTLSAAAAKEGRSVYLLGGDPGTAAQAANVLRERYPHLRIAGTHCPAMKFDHDEKAMRRIVDLVTQAQPDIVFVALGSPKQEQFIDQMRDCLPGTWWLGVGISFSFLCGHVQRAPQWMQRSGLEWLHRLIQEPRRLAKRYLVHGIPFAVSLLASSLISRGKLRFGRA